MTSTVKIIGICGYPEHGKTTAQRILEKVGVKAIDDSEAIRRLGMERYNLTWEDVSTQEGKSRLIFSPHHNKMVTIRQALGDVGNLYEIIHGPNYWIRQALAGIEGTSPVSFGSVRMGQAHAIRAAGGVVLAMHDPRRPRSDHHFDQFDHSAVDQWINNDVDMMTLEQRVILAVAPYLEIDAGNYLRELQQTEMSKVYLNG